MGQSFKSSTSFGSKTLSVPVQLRFNKYLSLGENRFKNLLLDSFHNCKLTDLAINVRVKDSCEKDLKTSSNRCVHSTYYITVPIHINEYKDTGFFNKFWFFEERTWAENFLYSYMLGFYLTHYCEMKDPVYYNIPLTGELREPITIDMPRYLCLDPQNIPNSLYGYLNSMNANANVKRATSSNNKRLLLSVETNDNFENNQIVNYINLEKDEIFEKVANKIVGIVKHNSWARPEVFCSKENFEVYDYPLCTKVIRENDLYHLQVDLISLLINLLQPGLLYLDISADNQVFNERLMEVINISAKSATNYSTFALPLTNKNIINNFPWRIADKHKFMNERKEVFEALEKKFPNELYYLSGLAKCLGVQDNCSLLTADETTLTFNTIGFTKEDYDKIKESHESVNNDILLGYLKKADDIFRKLETKYFVAESAKSGEIKDVLNYLKYYYSKYVKRQNKIKLSGHDFIGETGF
ncbi:hypothetical protein ABK040_000584 [Willaertia magna]